MQVRDVFGDSLCMKTRIKEGVGEFPVDCPLEDCDIKYHLIGRLCDDTGLNPIPVSGTKDNVFIDTYGNGEPFSVTLGMSLLPKGLDTSMRLMTEKEISHVLCHPKYAYDDPNLDCAKLRKQHDLPAECRNWQGWVLWEVELVSWVRQRSGWDELKFNEALANAIRLREQGNQRFREAKFTEAGQKYEAALRSLKRLQLEHEGNFDESVVRKPLALCLINLGAVAQKEGQSSKSITYCTEAIDADPSIAKAYYRRGMAYMVRGRWKEAKQDFDDMVVRDPSLHDERISCMKRLEKTQLDMKEAEKRQAQAMVGKTT